MKKSWAVFSNRLSGCEGPVPYAMQAIVDCYLPVSMKVIQGYLHWAECALYSCTLRNHQHAPLTYTMHYL